MQPTRYSPVALPGSDKGAVLVIEDNVTTRDRISRVLSTHGYRVKEAGDGREGLALAARERFDAILLDLVMPRMDGWQFRDAQRNRSQFPHVPTVFVTARALRVGERYVLGATDVVMKPFEDTQLLATVDRVVGRAAATTDVPPRPGHPVPDQLFWSRRGNVACQAHTPDLARWRLEGWAPILRVARNGVVYQCQYCPGAEGPIRRRKAGRRISGLGRGDVDG
jgi:CheY-like chemotaxis protein